MPSTESHEEALWALLNDAISAVQYGAGADHVAAMLALEKNTSREEQMRLALWLSHLIHAIIVGRLRHEPTEEELHELATRHFMAFHDFIRGGVVRLEDTLRTVFGYSPQVSKVAGSLFLVQGTVVAGSVLREAQVDAVDYRDGLRKWTTDNKAELEDIVRRTL
jgi:hypothetical protein